VTRVLLGQSYFLRFDPKLWRAMRPYPPLGTLYAASYLRDRGHDVTLFDAMLAEDEREWDGALDRHRPEVAVLFEDNFNYLSKMCLGRMREAALAMVAMARRRGATVIACGADATDNPDVYLRAGAHHVLLGEGEETLAQLLVALQEKAAGARAARDVPVGHAYLDEDGRVVVTARRPVLRDLDALSWPAWDLVDVEAYRAAWTDRHGLFSLNMVTTRGCPFHCNWCAKPIWGQRYSARSPEDVADELAWLRSTYSPDHIWFVDDILGLKPGWLAAFADAIEERGCQVPFTSLNRADLLLRDGDVDALARAGARTVWIGAESGSQRILDAMEKGTSTGQILEATTRLQESGVEVAWFLQFGYPGETRADIEATLQLVRDGRPDDIGISVSYPLPGTAFHDRVRAELGDKRTWDDSDDLAMLYHGPFTTDFYRQLHRVTHLEFRADRHRLALRTALARPARPDRAARHAAGIARNRLALPLARRRLDRLATQSHGAVGSLPTALSREAASTPTPQPDRSAPS
jgi:anaerobic magnesium-protoporphyrin IX monomethyl ester cyclase